MAGTGAKQDAPLSSVNAANNLPESKETTKLVIKGHFSKIFFGCSKIKLWFLAHNSIIAALCHL